ncbi:MAG: SusC/RagA family TonB-linked outer membrane protein, partial [Bacteroidetes bacterium]
KKGAIGKAKISVNASTGYVNLANRINFMNGEEYVKYLIDSDIAGGNENPKLNGFLDPVELENYIAGEDVDWQDVLLRTGRQNMIGISASGGNEKARYYLNGDYYSEDGIVTHSDYERFSLRFNGDYKVTDWLDIGARVQLSKSFADETANAITEFNINDGFAPFIPISNNTPLGDVYNDDGTPTKFVKGDQFQINPLHRYNESVLDRFVTRAYVNPYINVHFTKDLTYTLNTYAEDREDFYGRFWSTNYADGAPSTAQITETKGLTYLMDHILTYKKYFGVHSINATAVYGFQTYDYRSSNTEAENIPTNLLDYNAIGYALSEDTQYDWSRDDWGKVYYVGRVGYSYDDRYSLTLTMRRDGSSRFGPNNRWGNFPSASLAWNIHNESFMEGNLFNFLKLRLSYGVMGNDRFPTYFYRAGTNNVQIILGEETFNGFGLNTTASNPDLRWETSKQINGGFDFGIWKDKVSGSIDIYKTNTSDLLLFETIIGVVNNGYTQYASNVGETESHGVDLGINVKAYKGKDFTWTINANWAFDRNKIVRLSQTSTDADGKPIDNPANGWFIGQDIREIYDYEVIGIWQLDEADEAATWGVNPGDPKINDVNGDGVITSDDRTFLGNPTPTWYGGLNNTISYKGIELSALVEIVQGVTRVNSYIGGFAGRSNQIAIDYWTPDNPSNEWPRVGAGNALSGGLFTDALKVQDASFISLRNVSLGYTLPKSITDKVRIGSMSVYVRGNNLRYFTDYVHAFSPESGSGSYPVTRVWLFGTKIVF